jgi:hypothetical protein
MTKNTYTATAELKSQATDVAKQLQFKVSTDGYKDAWIEARNICRVGGKVQVRQEDGSFAEMDLPAGQYTVRKVFADNVAKASKKVLTAQDFLKAADANGIKVPQKLRELADSMIGPQTEEAGETTQEAA